MTVKPIVILGLMTFGPDESAGCRLTDLEDLEWALDEFLARGYTPKSTPRGATPAGSRRGGRARRGGKDGAENFGQ
ncbi:hypothetical protein QBC46DRAFT_346006 [Diplogelasinospora grovesii]|uniref:Uncharacterized protein n=1 Tax=Diplogelasinospora grovesii TaxID=303347 RepID=A0AAN6MYU4_9PEZI|nr:hypothetical protein QBC46DRAFT_346006 [Diplogelasinospora grovesii]